MTYPLVRFVDSPDPAAAIRYDFNSETASAPRQVRLGGLSLGYPTLQGEPDAVGAAYGFRRPRIGQRVYGAKADALLTLSSLSRELLRPTNWLMVQWSASTPPVWLRTYRSAEAELTLDQVYTDTETGDPVTDVGDIWEIDVPLVADAFGYGARETLDPVTIGNAFDATNPMRYVLPSIKGDAPTGLRVTITPLSGGTNGRADSWIVGVVGSSTGTVPDPTYDIGTGDIWTAGLADAPTNDAAYLGGSYRTSTYGTSAVGSFAALYATLSASPPPMGRYKVLLRCELDPASASVGKTFWFALGQALNGSATIGNTVMGRIVSVDTPTLTGSAYTFQGWVDLGEFTFPFDAQVPEDVSATPAAPLVLLYQHRPTDTVTNDVTRLDAIKLIPVDGPTIKRATFAKVATERVRDGILLAKFDASMALTVDGDAELLYKNAVSGGALMESPGSIIGGLPVADPAAAENVLYCFPQSRGVTSSTSAATAATATWQVDLSYRPRYLHLGDGT